MDEMNVILALFGLCTTASCQYSGYPRYTISNPIHIPLPKYQYNQPPIDGLISSYHPAGRGQYPLDRNQNRDGRNQYPDSRSLYPEVRNVNADRRGQYPDGRNQHQDRRGQYPDGRNLYPDRREQYPYEMNQYPDGMEQLPKELIQNSKENNNQYPNEISQYQDGNNPYSPGSVENVVNILPYTRSYLYLLKEFDDAFAIIKKKIAIPNPYIVYINEPYIMLLNAVDRLIDATLEADYNLVYAPTIQQAISETRNDTIGTADSVRARLDKTASQIALLRDVINDIQQTVCNHPTTELTCDQLIDNAVFFSNDQLLKREAEFFVALGREMNAFLTKFAAEFANIANVESAQQYLYFGKDRLKDLIENGARARRLGNGLQPRISHRSSTATVAQIDASTDENSDPKVKHSNSD